MSTATLLFAASAPILPCGDFESGVVLLFSNDPHDFKRAKASSVAFRHEEGAGLAELHLKGLERDHSTPHHARFARVDECDTVQVVHHDVFGVMTAGDVDGIAGQR